MKSAIHGGQNIVATFQVSWFGNWQLLLSLTNTKNHSADQDASITLSPPCDLARLEIPFESKVKLFVHHKSPMLTNKLSQGTRRKWQCIYKKPLVLQYQTNAVLAAFLNAESSQRSASGISASSLPVSSLLLHGVKTKGAQRSSLLRMGMTSVNHQCSSATCSNFIFPSRIWNQHWPTVFSYRLTQRAPLAFSVSEPTRLPL